jgi:GMP synthase-like glutamine amidotransferase
MPSSSRTALVIQHEPDGPAGLIGEELVRRGYELSVVQVMAPGSSSSSVVFPDPTVFDLVVPLGSVHSVYDDAAIGTWIHRELEMLRVAVDAGVPVFGICFGAQALAQALGGSVEKAPQPEIGWVDVVPAATHDVPSGPWFTWHLDRFVLPATATPVARTEVCTQIYRSGSSAGVQFHPEVDGDRVRHWVEHTPPGYFDAMGVDPRPMLDAFERHAPAAATKRSRLVEWFLEEVAA